MPDVDATADNRFLMECVRCHRPVTVRREWIGQEVHCPHCDSVLRVPPPDERGMLVKALAPQLGSRRFFNFGCPRCESLLEAHTGLCAQPGRCPTCGCRFVVPGLDYRGMPLPSQVLEGESQDPTPLHAYAASGHQAPRIVSAPDGSQAIQCPRCDTLCSIDADNCPSCGVPFSMDGTPTISGAQRDTNATAALVAGIIALPAFILILPAVLAIVFGLLSLRAGLRSGRIKLKALIGIGLGLASLGGAGYALFK
jgi:hypothetical protein